MLPNEKKLLPDLKIDFAEGSPTRITPKLLRDFLVSTMGSRPVHLIDDSQDLDEGHDIIIIGFNESGNYLRVPQSFSNDLSGTPIVFKFYTVINPTTYPVRIVTHPDDQFHNGEQEIIINPGQTSNIFAFGDKWWFFGGGSTTGASDSIGFPVRVETESVFGGDTVADSVPTSTKSVRWTVRLDGKTSGKTRTSEIMANIGATGDDYTESFIVGDDLDNIELKLERDGGNVRLILANHSAELVNIIVFRTAIS